MTRTHRLAQVLSLVLALSVSVLPGRAASLQPEPPVPLRQELERSPLLESAVMVAESREGAAVGETAVWNWSKLVFQSYRDSNWEIYIADGSGANQTRLTWDGAADIHPRLNRGGTKIAFASRRTGNYEIFVMNADGSGVTRLTNSGGDDVNPAWSPDGTRIAFQSYRDGQAEIYVMNADGSGQTRLTWDSGYDGDPAWSPDGSRLAFVSTRSGEYNIWVMNADGSGVTRLSTQAYSENPTWSPDGSRIAYDSDGNDDGWQELWVMNADGSNQHQAYDPTEYQTDAWAGSWSPDGRYVVFTRISFVYYGGNWYWTYSYLDAWDSVSGSVTRLSSQGTDWHPDWQTIDIQPPSSSVIALPAQSPGPFTVSWSGSDIGPSGIQSYDVQVREGAGTWTDWQIGTTATSASYPGIGGRTYYFRSRARDNAGNVEAWPASHDATTTVEALPPISMVKPLPAYSRRSVLVSWGGGDPGGSGIRAYDVQYREGEAGSWRDWLVGTTNKSATFLGTPGQTYYFRSRATDRAQNVESWPTGDGDARTTLYTWKVSGTVQDNTGVPVVGAVVTTTPGAFATTSSDGAGAYAAYVADNSGSYRVSWEKNGYGHLPPAEFDAVQDGYLDVFLPPADNVVRNGDFEFVDFGAEQWIAGGTIPPVITSFGHTGNRSVMLGTPFALATPRSFGPGSCPSVKIDSSGVLHVVWAGGGAILYMSKALGETWSSPVVISNPSPPGALSMPAIAVDDAGTIHVVWGNNYKLFHTRKPKDGNWSTPSAIPGAEGIPPSIAVDSARTVHLVWTMAGKVLYANLSPDRGWSEPIVIIDNGFYAVGSAAVVVDRDDIVHLIWEHSENGWQIFYANRSRSGVWSTPINISNSSDYVGAPDLTVDAEGTLHAVWTSNDGIMYASKPRNGLWGASVRIFPGHDPRAPAVAAHGTDLYLTWMDIPGYYDRFDIFYSRKKSGKGWQNPTNVSGSVGNSVDPSIAVDETGAPHIFWSDDENVHYVGPALAERDGDSRIVQPVVIPITISTPVLSFIYKTGGMTSIARDGFSVQVDSDVATTRLFSTTANTDIWTHEWLDLSPWVGQIVTLTFNLHQVAETPRTWVYLDEVFLGSTYPDLWVNKDAIAALPGEQVVYRITYGNRGGAPASGVHITDTMPSELLFIDADPPPRWGSAILWLWEVGDLPAQSGPYHVVVTATVSPTATIFSSFTNTVSIGSASAELETANNTANAAVFVGIRVYLPMITRDYFE